MVTFVGTQNNFDDAIVNLVELEYDAIGAYELALAKLSNYEYKLKLALFLEEHKQHIAAIKDYYLTTAVKLPSSADLLKGMMAKMKVMLGNFTGSDDNILRAILSNELDTNTAYERMVNHPSKPLDLDAILQKAYMDEKQQKQWLEEVLKLSC